MSRMLEIQLLSTTILTSREETARLLRAAAAIRELSALRLAAVQLPAIHGFARLYTNVDYQPSGGRVTPTRVDAVAARYGWQL